MTLSRSSDFSPNTSRPFAFWAYRRAFARRSLHAEHPVRSPGVTPCSSAPGRPHTPWSERWMDIAFVAIVPTRPCPLFGRPVHRRAGSHRLRPGASPHALRIPPRGGHPALPGCCRQGQRGATLAFGYGALHPSASGTSTHLSPSLPSAHCAPLRRPPPPPLTSRGEGRDPSRRWGSRVAPCSVPTRHAPYPGERPHGHRSVALTWSSGLPRFHSGSTLTTSLSRLARASHMLRPVDSQTHPWWATVPRASANRLPSLPPR